MPKLKKQFFGSIFFCWDASTYQISENFIRRFGFCQISLFLVNFDYFLAKKKTKKDQNRKTVFLMKFLLLGSITYQISENFIEQFEFWQFS